MVHHLPDDVVALPRTEGRPAMCTHSTTRGAHAQNKQAHTATKRKNERTNERTNTHREHNMRHILRMSLSKQLPPQANQFNPSNSRLKPFCLQCIVSRLHSKRTPMASTTRREAITKLRGAVYHIPWHQMYLYEYYGGP